METLEFKIAEYVGNFTRMHGYPPTVEELVNSLGFMTVMCAAFYVLNLYRIGMIRNSLFFGTTGLRLLPVKAK